MCVYSVVCYFVGIHLGYTFAFLGALLFVGFIIYDTDKIMKKMVLKKKSVSVLYQYKSKSILYGKALKLCARAATTT